MKYWLIFLLVFLHLTRLKARQILSRLIKNISLYFKRRHLIIYKYYEYKISSKKAFTCPICPSIINLSQHLNGVDRIGGQERKQLIQREMVGSEVMITKPKLTHTESHIEKHTSLLQCEERLRIELMKKQHRIAMSFPPLLLEINHCQIRKNGC